ncbi:hypothetical protein F0562_009596 [Nyssa sinensis]|uniref:Uncharacterized protein n=1 Tax=Nyssa sinensis TaxID=561372 RepID=A0A5J4ZWG2_9ASTE|nr:hypothetical protein F0562_009596 [Nyssa sinensis]
MGTPETSREPCPDRILDDIGGAFGMGAVGGSAFHFIKGVYNSPKGERFVGGTQAVRMNAPRVGGSFRRVGWPILRLRLHHGLRPPEGGPLELHHGWRRDWWLSPNASGCRRPLPAPPYSAASFLALIEGAGIMLNKVMSAQQNMPIMIEEPMPNMAGGPGFQLPNRSYNSNMQEAGNKL